MTIYIVSESCLPWYWHFSIDHDCFHPVRTPRTLCTCAVSWFRQGIHEDSEDNEAPKELNAWREAELAELWFR